MTRFEKASLVIDSLVLLMTTVHVIVTVYILQ
jgi:hypothetical protein